jgi:hypothetical protein
MGEQNTQKKAVDFRSMFVYSEGSSAGSGAGQTAASNKSSLSGETPKRPATLWTVTYRMGPSFRGPWWT